MEYLYPIIHSSVLVSRKRGAGGGVELRNFGVGMCRWDLGPLASPHLAYTRASSAEFCYPILH